MIRAMDEVTLREIFRALDREAVRYSIFGGIALAAHGLSRATKDLDLFVDPAPANVAALCRALSAVLADPAIAEITAEDLEEYGLVRYGLPEHDFVIDVTARIGEAFRHDQVETQSIVLLDVPVRVVTPRQLARMKEAAGRPQDLADLVKLRERFGPEID